MENYGCNLSLSRGLFGFKEVCGSEEVEKHHFPLPKKNEKTHFLFFSFFFYTTISSLPGVTVNFVVM